MITYVQQRSSAFVFFLCLLGDTTGVDSISYSVLVTYPTVSGRTLGSGGKVRGSNHVTVCVVYLPSLQPSACCGSILASDDMPDHMLWLK